MNKREAGEWVHTQMIVGEMPFDDLVLAFTALVGRVPDAADRPHGLFRRCCEIVLMGPAVAANAVMPKVGARKRA